MHTLFKVLVFGFTLNLIACSSDGDKQTKRKKNEIESPTNKIKLAKDISWEMLNPARGKNSPLAGTIWGDRKGEEPTGFLVKFIDGFSSPPHIHNVSYRGIVIEGLVHNDDSSAQDMWMPKGSFWTQPKGKQHITSAKGKTNIAYIEIDTSPYLVMPAKEAFESNEKPINIDASNLVWLSENNSVSIKGKGEISYLWGKNKENSFFGTFVKIPKGYKGDLKSEGSIFRGIIIENEISYQMPNELSLIELTSGSSFSSEGKSIHHIETNKECLIYIRTNGNFSLNSK